MVKSVGHEKIKTELKDKIMSNSIGHAYLFSGRAGIGKKLVAVEFAKSILCDLPDANGEPCGACASCKTFENNSDFKIVEPDEKNSIKVDVVRDLISEIFLMPTISLHKVYIINDAECMNEQAQNALLKILEEPPKYVTLILIASNKESLLGTIKSRVTEISFDALTKSQIEEILQKEISDEIYRFSKGSVSEIIKLDENDEYVVAKELADTLETKDFLKINKKLNEIKENKTLKSNMGSILEKVMKILHQHLREKTDEYRIIEQVQSAITKIKKNANVDLTLDVLNIEICNL